MWYILQIFVAMPTALHPHVHPSYHLFRIFHHFPAISGHVTHVTMCLTLMPSLPLQAM